VARRQASLVVETTEADRPHMSTNDRDLIFGRIQSALDALRTPAPLPEFADEQVIRRDSRIAEAP